MYRSVGARDQSTEERTVTTRLVLGGPGAGKTERMMRAVEEALERGVPPDRIAYTSFTRRAAHEARDRAAERFDAGPGGCPR